MRRPTVLCSVDSVQLAFHIAVWSVVVIGVLYELLAVWSQVRRHTDPTVTVYPTISQSITRASRRLPWLKWLVLSLSVLLLAHFFWGLWA